MVDVTCASCGVQVLVIPSAMRQEISDEMVDEVEAHVAGLTTSDGKRLVIADDTGHFTCPVCGTRGNAPPIDLG
jgi:predicted RNA-binding Zn-ribbon protein involved in translation (DUF1610 family)